jgi:hypothetical protein
LRFQTFLFSTFQIASLFLLPCGEVGRGFSFNIAFSLSPSLLERAGVRLFFLSPPLRGGREGLLVRQMARLGSSPGFSPFFFLFPCSSSLSLGEGRGEAFLLSFYVHTHFKTHFFKLIVN